MDPRACLNLADQSISEGDIAQAKQSLSDYRVWRRKGGFEPTMEWVPEQRGDSFAHEIEQRLETRIYQDSL